MHNIYVYILIMAAVTFLIRIAPLTLIRKEIRSPFLKSFLYYVPYVTLAVMTVPAILRATNSPVPGAIALAGGIAAAWKGIKMFYVALICCALVLLAELLSV